MQKFAEETDLAVVAITHPPKAEQSKAINSFTGSFAFAAAPRMTFIVIEEQETGRTLLLAVKNNLTRKADGLGYRLGLNDKRRGH